MLKSIKPRLLVAYGKDAGDYLAGNPLGIPVWPKSHFSRGWSEEKARELGREIIALIDSPAGAVRLTGAQA